MQIRAFLKIPDLTMIQIRVVLTRTDFKVVQIIYGISYIVYYTQYL